MTGSDHGSFEIEGIEGFESTHPGPIGQETGKFGQGSFGWGGGGVQPGGLGILAAMVLIAVFLSSCSTAENMSVEATCQFWQTQCYDELAGTAADKKIAACVTGVTQGDVTEDMVDRDRRCCDPNALPPDGNCNTPLLPW